MFGRRSWGWRAAAYLAAYLGGSVLLLAGCGDFFNKNSSGGGGSSTGSYTYVGTTAGGLASYSVSSTGALAALSGSPLSLSTSAINALAVTPNNSFLYAAVAGAGVYGLSINSSSGVATLINTSALVQDVSPLAMTVDPSGKYVLVAGLYNGSAAVGEYSINSDGTLSEVSGSPITISLPSGTNTSNLTVQNIVVAPSSSYVFVALGQVGVAGLPFNTSGTLSVNTNLITPKTSTGSGTTVNNQDLGLAVNAGSTALFIGETNVGVRVITIGSNSSFTEISGSPFAAGGQPRSLSFDGSGDYLYAANYSDGTISGYSVLASGSLTALTGSPFSSVGTGPNALALDKSKKFLIAANESASPYVQVFSFDSTTGGKLDPGATVTDNAKSAVIASTH